MAYCVQADVSKRVTSATLIELTDDTGAGSVDTDNLDAAIEAADALIDSYLGDRFDLPLDDTPDRVKYASVAITIYKLYARRADAGMPPAVESEYTRTAEWLKEVRDGEAQIDSPAEATDRGLPIIVNPADDETVFTDDSLQNF